MERLTYRGTPHMEEGEFVTPAYSDYSMRQIINKLADYEDAEEQGLLLRLPCKVGDIVFDNDFKEVYPYRITGFSFGIAEDYIDDPVKEDEIVYYCINSTGSITGSFASSEIGKTVFLTKEEAEKKLAEMKEGAIDGE